MHAYVHVCKHCGLAINIPLTSTAELVPEIEKVCAHVPVLYGARDHISPTHCLITVHNTSTFFLSLSLSLSLSLPPPPPPPPPLPLPPHTSRLILYPYYLRTCDFKLVVPLQALRHLNLSTHTTHAHTRLCTLHNIHRSHALHKYT